MRKISTKGLRKKAWDLFSIWVRQRKVDDDVMPEGANKCVTCGVIENWKYGLQAGHYIHGKNWMSGMDERNVWPQCVKCNKYLSGNAIPYSQFLLKKYGINIIETLQELRCQGWKPSRQELEDIVKRYSNAELNEMINEAARNIRDRK